jgi:hypothetical protein
MGVGDRRCGRQDRHGSIGPYAMPSPSAIYTSAEGWYRRRPGGRRRLSSCGSF